MISSSGSTMLFLIYAGLMLTSEFSSLEEPTEVSEGAVVVVL
jgi:hypothetical protein